MAKILEHAAWDEIWHYLTVEQIAADLPYLRLPRKTAALWRYALDRWQRKRGPTPPERRYAANKTEID